MNHQVGDFVRLPGFMRTLYGQIHSKDPVGKLYKDPENPKQKYLYFIKFQNGSIIRVSESEFEVITKEEYETGLLLES